MHGHGLGAGLGAPARAGCPAKLAAGKARAGPVRVAAILERQTSFRPPEPPVLPFRRDAEHLSGWSADTWRSLEAKQQPNYPDAAKLDDAVSLIGRMPPLVFAGECRNLQERLALCAAGEAFWLQGTTPVPPAPSPAPRARPCSLPLARLPGGAALPVPCFLWPGREVVGDASQVAVALVVVSTAGGIFMRPWWFARRW